MILYKYIFIKIFILLYINNFNLLYIIQHCGGNEKQIITATALMLAISSTAYASDNINIFVNGNALNTGAFIMNDSTYIPLRAVSEALGSNVNWDGNTRSVYIDSDEDTVTAQVIENASSSVVATE